MDHAIPLGLLRRELLPLVLGILVVASGLAACLLSLPRARRRNLAPLYFGITATMYGVRVLVNTATLNLLAPGFRHAFWVTDRVVTGLIVTTFTLFFIETLAIPRRKLLVGIIALELLEGIFYIVAYLSGHGEAIAGRANHVTVLITFPLVLILFFPRRKPDLDLWVVVGGFACMMGFAAYGNVLALQTGGDSRDREYIGFIVLLGAVGFAAARQALRKETKLIAIDRELEIARGIQTGLLPDHAVSVPGVAIAAKYIPVSSVAGDFYDFLIGEDGRHLGVLIADVSGHGVPAALSASMVKIAIRSQAEHAKKPSAVLSGLNSVLYGNMQGQFVTAAYVSLDEARRSLSYAGAGHPPLLVWRAAEDRVEALEENGLFLGAFPRCEYATMQTQVGPGDRFLLYTDGIVEAPSPAGEEFGNGRLVDFLAANCRLPGTEFCDALVEQIRRWCARGQNQEQHDDLTLVVIDLLPASNH